MKTLLFWVDHTANSNNPTPPKWGHTTLSDKPGAIHSSVLGPHRPTNYLTPSPPHASLFAQVSGGVTLSLLPNGARIGVNLCTAAALRVSTESPGDREAT